MAISLRAVPTFLTIARVAFLAGATCACAKTPSTEGAPVPASSTQPSPRVPASLDLAARPFVLVRQGAFMYTAKPPAGTRAHNPYEPPNKERPHQAARFEALRQDGEFIEVKTSPQLSDPRHCHDSSSLFDGFELRVFVRRDDLLPVTVRPVVLRGGEEREVVLSAGAPVIDGVAYVDGVEVPAAVPKDAIDFSYAPGPAPSAPPTPKVLAKEATVDLGQLGLVHLDEVSGYQNMAGREPTAFPNVRRAFAYGARERDSGADVELRTACATYHGFATKLEAPGSLSSTFQPMTHPNRAEWEVREGAAVSFGAAAPSGKTTRRLSLALEPSDVVVTGRRCLRYCLQQSLCNEPESSFPMCFDTADIAPPPGTRTDSEAAAITARTRRIVSLSLVNKTSHPDAEVALAVRRMVKGRAGLDGALTLSGTPERDVHALARSKRLQALVLRITLEDRVAVGLAPEQGLKWEARTEWDDAPSSTSSTSIHLGGRGMPGAGWRVEETMTAIGPDGEHRGKHVGTGACRSDETWDAQLECAAGPALDWALARADGRQPTPFDVFPP